MIGFGVWKEVMYLSSVQCKVPRSVLLDRNCSIVRFGARLCDRFIKMWILIYKSGSSP
ncbi:hypothetical protein ZIOFF_026767 [Zingiber officinale]|uniref:Uncharacterized protein n=1 Tax=Zingiber officinale TaxID=94328 RepID=A0A8J5GWT9_ZINOF|nr:hypothetical protein ZIOFF_026767 [Zingiber officinale]